MQKCLLTLRELELLSKLVIARESSESRNLKMPGTLGPSCWRFLPPCIAAAQVALPSRWGPFHTASYHLRKIRLGTRRHDKRRPPWKLQATSGWSTEFRMTIWEPGGEIQGCVNRIKRVDVDLCAWLALRFCVMTVMWYQRLSKPRRVWRGNAFISPQLGRQHKFKGKPRRCSKTFSFVWCNLKSRHKKTFPSYCVGVSWDDPHNSLFLFSRELTGCCQKGIIFRLCLGFVPLEGSRQAPADRWGGTKCSPVTSNKVIKFMWNLIYKYQENIFISVHMKVDVQMFLDSKFHWLKIMKQEPEIKQK